MLNFIVSKGWEYCEEKAIERRGSVPGLGVSGPSDGEVKSCLEEGRHEARRQVSWSD